MSEARSTLAAVATAPGVGAVAIVRISGPRAWSITRTLCDLPVEMPKRDVWVRDLSHDGRVLDQAVVLGFRGPNSFTGEDIVELQVHGGSLNVEAVLAAVLESGAQVAEPGEFTRRALENGRMDLVQVEGLGSLIYASSEAARRQALQELTGGLSARFGEVSHKLTLLMVQLEAAIDFALEEHVETISNEELTAQIEGCLALLQKLADSWRDGRLRAEGVRVALIGLPNAGKSTTLNTLLDEDRALVTPIAGTTRDFIEASWSAQGLRFVLVDTAGIRDTADPIEALGVERSRAQLEQADVVLLVADARSAGAAAELLPSDFGRPRAVVFSHLDLVGADWQPPADFAELPQLSLDLLGDPQAGDRLEGLLLDLARSAGWGAGGEAPLISRARHRDLVLRAMASLRQALASAGDFMPEEVVALDVREALDAMGAITGAVTSDDVLNMIFEGFCIGK